VLDFSWEPRGERFAIVSSSDPNVGNPGPGITIKTDISFYQLDRQKGDFKQLSQFHAVSLLRIKVTDAPYVETLPGRTSNTVRWSPKGRHVVLATVGSSSKSELEFWDLDFHSEEPNRKETEWGSGIQQLGVSDHYGVTDAEWDPSGRYIATSASAWRHTVSNAVHRSVVLGV
jgi:translation initiation factor 3 subunit B